MKEITALKIFRNTAAFTCAPSVSLLLRRKFYSSLRHAGLAAKVTLMRSAGTADY
jgi:hypothetical protein